MQLSHMKCGGTEVLIASNSIDIDELKIICETLCSEQGDCDEIVHNVFKSYSTEAKKEITYQPHETAWDEIEALLEQNETINQSESGSLPNQHNEAQKNEIASTIEGSNHKIDYIYTVQSQNNKTMEIAQYIQTRLVGQQKQYEMNNRNQNQQQNHEDEIDHDQIFCNEGVISQIVNESVKQNPTQSYKTQLKSVEEIVKGDEQFDRIKTALQPPGKKVEFFGCKECDRNLAKENTNKGLQTGISSEIRLLSGENTTTQIYDMNPKPQQNKYKQSEKQYCTRVVTGEQVEAKNSYTGEIVDISGQKMSVKRSIRQRFACCFMGNKAGYSQVSEISDNGTEISLTYISEIDPQLEGKGIKRDYYDQ